MVERDSPCSTMTATHTTNARPLILANVTLQNGTRAMRSSSAANTGPHRNAVRKKASVV
ncbi:Uncharacterised protein [Salmonella enterica subsp. enterica serovar Bovismorbificans]|uniref:Uncharacterized protein n=1 Tax=Salmonella enterica subsp. enterica serovar Bovismorbificans TaxID=58097 RepID=A0A655DSG4_SALET|nr:Uncharacterised protein [Salmonella enterica subsp. enterica serovar Bovismorbificans]CNV34903.1 Uncharacterised protein [Salmonella enterica subsp. enterica serovar Bovismorbificans]